MRYMVLMNEKNEYIAIDDVSGGYPYYTDRLDIARIWAEPFFGTMYNYIKANSLKNVKPVEICDARELEKLLSIKQ